MRIRTFLTILLVTACSLLSRAQYTISGTVYDTTKIVPVKDVLVLSTGGTKTMTDSVGRYEIVAGDADSLVFIYNNKSTEKFPVRQIKTLNDFSLSLHVRVNEKYKTLKEVRVFAKTYRQDSIENRAAYAKVFGYDKPGISTASSTYSGAVGLDLDEFINIFRFRRNKQMQNLQRRLINEEHEKYVDYRFNKTLVRRITGLKEKELDDFMILYRPTYEFSSVAPLTDFYQYILNSSYQYKKLLLQQQVKPKAQP